MAEEETERSIEEHKEQALGYIKPVEGAFPASKIKEVSDACYTFSELSLWGDFEGKIDWETAVRIWSLVESVKRKGFPANLRM